MTDTSSSRHGQSHAYGVHDVAFPGSLTAHGASCQQLRTEILAKAEVGKPAVRRADKKPRTRADRRSPKK